MIRWENSKSNEPFCSSFFGDYKEMRMDVLEAFKYFDKAKFPKKYVLDQLENGHD